MDTRQKKTHINVHIQRKLTYAKIFGFINSQINANLDNEI